MSSTTPGQGPGRTAERTQDAPERTAPAAPAGSRPGAALRPGAGDRQDRQGGSREGTPSADGDPDADRDRGRDRAAAESPRPAPVSSARPGPRQVRLSVARIDPWSVMKLAFLLSIAVGIGIVVATAAMWFVLDTMHVFADIQTLLDDLGSESFINLLEYAQLDRVVSMAAIVAVIDVLLLTALATLGAFLYNIVAALVGGLHVTLTDD